MLDHAKVITILQEMGINVAGAIVEDSGAPRHLFIHVAVVRDSNNKQVPSNRKLSDARDALLAVEGITVEFLLTDGLHQDIEAGLRATVLHAFGSNVRNVFMSITDGTAQVWIEPKQTLDEVVSKAIFEKVRTYISGFNVELSSLTLTTGENFPSVLGCLRAIRQLAPVTPSDLLQELIIRGFTVPSIDWLKRRLDAMRKKGQVVRLEGNRYVLSLGCIRSLGTIKGRSSPDVTRVLALARRRM